MVVWVCCSLISVAVISTMTKDNLGKKKAFWFTGYTPLRREVRAGDEERAEVETMETCC